MKAKKVSELGFFLQLKNFLHTRQFQFGLSAVACAFIMAFSFIGFSRLEMNGNSLLASVANSGNNHWKNAHFEADLALRDVGTGFELIAWKSMEKVDFVEWVIAFDPNSGLSISSEWADVELTELAPGMHRFIIQMHQKNIENWTIIARFSKNEHLSTHITFIDTQFVSENIRYNLSNIVK